MKEVFINIRKQVESREAGLVYIDKVNNAIKDISGSDIKAVIQEQETVLAQKTA